MSHSQTDGVKDLLIPLQPVFPLYLCSLYDKAVLERQNTREQTIKVQKQKKIIRGSYHTFNTPKFCGSLPFL